MNKNMPQSMYDTCDDIDIEPILEELSSDISYALMGNELDYEIAIIDEIASEDDANLSWHGPSPDLIAPLNIPLSARFKNYEASEPIISQTPLNLSSTRAHSLDALFAAVKNTNFDAADGDLSLIKAQLRQEEMRLALQEEVLESKATSRKLSIPPTLSKASQTESLNDDMKKTLADMSLIEAEEAIKKSDYQSAISHLRDVINYAPDQVDAYLKLAQLLSEEQGYRAEVEELINKAIELDANNLAALSLLAELHVKKDIVKPSKVKTSKRTTPNPALRTGPNAILEKISTPLDILTVPNPTDVTNTKDAKEDLSSQKDIGESLSNTESLKRSTKKEKSRKRPAQVGFIESGNSSDRPRNLSILNLGILMVIITVFVGSIFYSFSLKSIKVPVALIAPPTNAALRTDDIDLVWKSPADEFLIEFEENGQLLFQRITKETRYHINGADLKYLRPYHHYTWRVIPRSSTGDPLPYQGEDSSFNVLTPNKNVTNQLKAEKGEQRFIFLDNSTKKEINGKTNN